MIGDSLSCEELMPDHYPPEMRISDPSSPFRKVEESEEKRGNVKEQDDRVNWASPSQTKIEMESIDSASVLC